MRLLKDAISSNYPKGYYQIIQEDTRPRSLVACILPISAEIPLKDMEFKDYIWFSLKPFDSKKDLNLKIWISYQIGEGPLKKEELIGNGNY